MRTPLISVRRVRSFDAVEHDGITCCDGSSVRLDAGGLDEFAVLLDLSAEKRVELGVRHLERFAAERDRAFPARS